MVCCFCRSQKKDLRLLNNAWSVLSVHERSCRYLFILNIDSYQPGSQAASPQPHEHRTDQFSEGSGVHRIQFVLLAVPQVMVVERAPGKADAFRRLVVIQQPLELYVWKT